MKVSTACVILGAVAIGGYFTYKYFEKNKNSDKGFSENIKRDNYTDINEENEKTEEVAKVSAEESIDEVVELFENKKTDVQHNVVQRHEEAAKIIKESMNHILSENTESGLSENKEDLDKIDDALDKLLDE